MTKLTEHEQLLLFNLIEKVTGNNQSGIDKKQLFVNLVESLMFEFKIDQFNQFLLKLENSDDFYLRFVSVVTIHTTYWFREERHFAELKKMILDRINQGQTSFKVWSAGCSTGQESLSLALVFEKMKETNPFLDYKIYGTDIDAISIEKAKVAIYPEKEISSIPSEFHHFILLGEQKRKGFFTLTKEIRNRCHFNSLNLNQLDYGFQKEDFDFIFCRNVLIYFHPNQVVPVVRKLASHLKKGGKLFLGMSEPLNQNIYELKGSSLSIYEKINLLQNQANILNKPTVLIVDDVEMIRTVIQAAFSKAGFNCLAASSAKKASEIVKQNSVDFITLDLNLPEQDGAEWLRRQRMAGNNIPTVVISGSSPDEANRIYGALNFGAIEFIEKRDLSKRVSELVKLAFEIVLKNRPDLQSDFRESTSAGVLTIPSPSELLNQRIEKPAVFLIGASTGGPSAIWTILKNIPQPCPPIVIVQHHAAYFASEFGKLIAEVSGLKFGRSESGTCLEQNTFYISQGDYHLEIEQNNNMLMLQQSKSEPEHGFRPSIDRLFFSVAKLKIPSISVLLTGMGADGAKGMLELFKSKWSYTMAQSKESCVVFGMPKEAIALNCVREVGDLNVIRKKLLDSSKYLVAFK